MRRANARWLEAATMVRCTRDRESTWCRNAANGRKESHMAMDEFSRRRFLTFLAGSPLFIAAGIDHESLQRLLSCTARGQSEAFGLIDQVPKQPPAIAQGAQQPHLIGAPGEALDIFDFEPVARG